MVKPITRDEVKRRIDAGSAIVVEALPASYYAEAHLPGTLNLPVDEVEKLAPTLVPHKDSAVIVYCADSPCQNSGTVAKHLSELGYTQVFDYDEGKADWIAAGMPTESGN
ncbi:MULTISPECIES: rhodanese-like domain-containing protein [Amycolatopsis]|uniref:Rhodanese-like domain-containing protein n=1 Tax=Amycolatopsis albidoflavus TaxID=102226 RepID=A0ABW5I277_9PSEU